MRLVCCLLGLVLCGVARDAVAQYARSLEEIEPELTRLIEMLNDADRPLTDRLAAAGDQRRDVQRQLLNKVDELQERPVRQALVKLFLSEGFDENLRTAAVSALASDPLDQEMADILARAINESPAPMRRFACQSAGFAKMEDGVNLDGIHKALLNALE